MTVSSQTSNETFFGNGVTTVWDLPFRFFDNTDIHAYLVNPATQVTTPLAQGTDYTLTGAGLPEQFGFAPGKITTTVPVADGMRLYVERVMEVEQLTDIVNQGRFFAEVHEDVFDRITMLIQQTLAWLSRALVRPVGKDYYDAENRLIKNLGDGADQQDAVNVRTMRNYVDSAIAGVVGGFGYFLQFGAGAILRTFQSKMRDVVSVTDFAGADPTGVTESTTAFLYAGIGAYVPKGFFLVDALQVDLTQYHGPGVIYTTGGQTMRLDNAPQSTHYKQRKVMEVLMGFDGSPSLPNTQIYPGAQNAPQGLALDRDPATGQRYFYISQGVSGSSWGPDERVRISKWAYREDGLSQAVDSFTPPVLNSHAHLSTLREGGKLWIYQSAATVVGAPDATISAGKGWSKMEWKGAANSDADLIQYRVWGQPGSGHRYQHYGKGCVQVSQDGKYMILIGINYSGSAGGRTLFVYDRRQVEAMANPLLAEPVFASHSLKAMDNDAETAYQGETTDGRYIYICWGSSAVYSRKGVTVYSLTGEKIKDIIFEGPASLYTDNEIRNGHPTLGTCISFEAEGISIQGGSIHVNFVDYWRASSPVVSYFGINYVNTNSVNTNNPPSSSPLYWRPTDLAATAGAWNSATTYDFLGSANTRRTKIIYAIEPVSDDPRQLPCVSRYIFPFSVAVNPSSASELVDASVPLGGAYTGSQHNVNNDTYRRMFRYLFNYSFDIYDCREGSDNSVRGFSRINGFTGGERSYQFGCGDGTAAGGAIVTMYAADSSTLPGSIRLATAAPTASSEIRALVGGATKFNMTNTENVIYQTARYIDDNLYAWGTPSRVATTIYLQTAPVVSSDARRKTDVRSMEAAEIAVGRKLAREFGFYKWLCSIEEKGEQDARWHSGMTVQRAIDIFKEEGLDPFAYGAVCHDVWGDEFETVNEVWLGTGNFKVVTDKQGNRTTEEIMEKWADAAERQTLWAGDKFSFREPQLHALVMRALAYDQDQIMQRLDALESK